MSKKLYIILPLIALFVAGTVSANHAWGKYHWDISTADSTISPLELGDNLSTVWGSSLTGASIDWNLSVLKNQISAGASNADCDPTSGRVEICNGEYGDNGWLGIASVWATRGKSNHIVQGVVKVNDTYFNTPSYNTDAWRNLVMCQEIGHTFGLDHQDEAFNNANLGTCMDYTNDPDGTILGQLDNQHPNQHDYDMMTEMHSHLNSTDGGGGGGKPDKGNGGGNGGGKGKPADVGSHIDFDDPSSWGRAIAQDASGKDSLFEKNLGNGRVVVTHVTWIN
ncbi:hypothetical protein COB55_01135 [Candidatus Wolfebacteria bacterium]|nr:MAG: hypothetical protein COB55_01135 [Candidatus Wolfebacteria bacterium]